MNIYLDDTDSRKNLYPLSVTRHVGDIRLGILTLREKWERITGCSITPDRHEADLVIPASMVPTSSYRETAIVQEFINYPWDLFRLNDREIRRDFELITAGRNSEPLPETVRAVEPGSVFIEEGARLQFCSLNASSGPIYIAKNAEIMEGSLIRGPFSLGENSVVKMGSKIYGGTTVGPNCVVGGEIKNSIFLGNSNKAHDGYLGDSVIGEWCNLGAGTSNSNVKNTGGEVKYVGPHLTEYAGSKAGLIMGDYSRCAINTSFNTGTIVGICCNIFEGRPAKFVADFSWGNEKYILEKALNDIQNWKKMKNQELSSSEINMITNLYLNN